MSLLVNTDHAFGKGGPRNFVPPAATDCLVDVLVEWKKEEKLSRIVDHAEIRKNDYSISLSHYIYTGDAEIYPPLSETVTELDAIEADVRKTDKALREILEKIGI